MPMPHVARMLVVLGCLPVVLTAQQQGIARTPWGDPDLQGIWVVRDADPAGAAD